MRWKIRQRSHDRRLIDLSAALAIVIAIVAIGSYFSQSHELPATSAFIEPSQSVHW